MERFIMYEVHEYMDMYPSKRCRTFKGQSEEEIEDAAKDWCHQMNLIYSGGTTKYIKMLNAKEAKAYIDEQIAIELCQSQPDEEWIAKVKQIYNECYK